MSAVWGVCRTYIFSLATLIATILWSRLISTPCWRKWTLRPCQFNAKMERRLASSWRTYKTLVIRIFCPSMRIEIVLSSSALNFLPFVIVTEISVSWIAVKIDLVRVICFEAPESIFYSLSALLLECAVAVMPNSSSLSVSIHWDIKLTSVSFSPSTVTQSASPVHWGIKLILVSFLLSTAIYLASSSGFSFSSFLLPLVSNCLSCAAYALPWVFDNFFVETKGGCFFFCISIRWLLCIVWLCAWWLLDIVWLICLSWKMTIFCIPLSIFSIG